MRSFLVQTLMGGLSAPRRRAAALLVILATLLFAAVPARAADFLLTPAIRVNEEYTDNIAEDEARSRGGEFITRAMPSLTLHYATPFWLWDVSLRDEYRYYARNKRNDENLPGATVKNRTVLIDERFFLDLFDEYSRVSLDQSQDRTKESLFFQQSDQNNLNVTPNMVLRITPKLVLRPSVSYQNLWYRSGAGVNRNIYGGGTSAEYELTPKFSFTSSYNYSLTDAQGNLSRIHSVYAGARYEYFKECFISAQGGYSWITNQERQSGNPLWNFQVNYKGELTNFRLGAGQVYSNDPASSRMTLNSTYELGVDLNFRRGSAGLSSAVVQIENQPGNGIFSISYNNSVSLRYEIFRDWETSLGYSFNYIDIRHSDTYTINSLFSPALTYSWDASTKVSLVFSLLHMYSPDIPVDNKDINRGLIEFSKTF